MKALYRKYRPCKLADVVGQEQVTEVLAAALEQGKISHAYLFIGPRGTGKTSVARIFAHEVNDFPYTAEDDYVDIIEIDGASNRGIDNIRELREKAAIAPTAGKYKIYIIDEVHMLTKEAFNALLKTLEEPPAHVIFIMATTDAYKVPVTITSRAQTYTFKLAEPAVMTKYLGEICEKEKIKIEEKALEIVVKRGGGSFRDTLSLLDQISTLSDGEITKEMVVAALGLPEDEKVAELLGSYAEFSPDSVVKITTLLKELLSSGVKAETLAEEMIEKIVAEPRPELLSLLSKLTEVKAPFAEAKLLVALMGETSFSGRTWPPSAGQALGLAASGQTPAPVSSKPRLESPEASYAGRPAEPSATQTNLSAALGIYAPKNSNQDMASRETGAGTSSIAFDWQSFVDKVKELNDVLPIHLQKTKHLAGGNALHIYPEKKIAKTILAKENNRKVLEEAAGLKVVVHDEGEAPENLQNPTKDATLDQISAIMGGEVLNDGGNNPFE